MYVTTHLSYSRSRWWFSTCLVNNLRPVVFVLVELLLYDEAHSHHSCSRGVRLRLLLLLQLTNTCQSRGLVKLQGLSCTPRLLGGGGTTTLHRGSIEDAGASGLSVNCILLAQPDWLTRVEIHQTGSELYLLPLSFHRHVAF